MRGPLPPFFLKHKRHMGVEGYGIRSTGGPLRGRHGERPSLVPFLKQNEMIKKQFLDYLYERRAALQEKIDGLADGLREGEPMPKDFEDRQMFIYEREKKEVELEATRKQILEVNKAIEKYLEVHIVEH